MGDGLMGSTFFRRIWLPLAAAAVRVCLLFFFARALLNWRSLAVRALARPQMAGWHRLIVVGRVGEARGYVVLFNPYTSHKLFNFSREIRACAICRI